MLQQSHAEFPATRWSLIDAITAGSASERTGAMRAIAESYWPAIYAFLRRQGKTREQAAELTQSFFVDIILERGLLEHAQSNRGTLRGLLLTALKNHSIDQHRRANSGVRCELFSDRRLADEDRLHEQVAELGPERLFERRWMVATLSEVIRRCERHYNVTGRAVHWNAFELRILQPSLNMTPPPSHEEVAITLKLASAADSVAAVRVVRKRLLVVLRQIIAETIPGSADQVDEYNRVIALLA